MMISSNASIPYFFTRPGAIAPSDEILRAQIIRRDLFKKINDGEVIRFVITSLLLSDGRVILVVEHADHLPLLDEVLKALESFNG